MTSGEVIRARREELGLSIAELSRRSGLAREYVSKIENGHVGVGAKTADKLAPALEIEPEELLAEKIEPANLTTLLGRVDGQREVLERVVTQLEHIREDLDGLLVRVAELDGAGQARRGAGAARRKGKGENN